MRFKAPDLAFYLSLNPCVYCHFCCYFCFYCIFLCSFFSLLFCCVWWWRACQLANQVEWFTALMKSHTKTTIWNSLLPFCEFVREWEKSFIPKVKLWLDLMNINRQTDSNGKKNWLNSHGTEVMSLNIGAYRNYRWRSGK